MKTTTLFLFILLFNSSCKHSPYMKWQWHEKKSSRPTSFETYSPSITVTPDSGSFNPLPSSFSIYFPEDLELSHWNGEAISVTGSGECAPAPLLATSLTGQIMTLTLHTTGCNQGDEIVIELKENLLYSKIGIAGVGSRFFRLRLDQSYAPAPTLSLVSGKVSSLPVSLNVSFDSEVDMGSVMEDLLQVSGSGACAGELPVIFVKAGSVATFSFDPSTCVHGDKLEFTVDQTKFSDISGRSGTGSTIVSVELDQVGPRISDLTAEPLTGNVNPLPGEIKVNLPSDIDTSTVSLDDFSISVNTDCTGATISGFSLAGGRATLGLDASSCLNGGEVSISFDLSEIRDIAGNSGTGSYSMAWKLISELPAFPNWSIASATVSTLPPQIDLIFDSTVDKTTVSSAFDVSAPAPCPQPFVTGTSWVGNTLQVSTNSSGCAHGAQVSFTIDMTKIKNLVGIAGSGASSRNFIFDLVGPGAPLLTPGEGSFLNIPSSIEVLFAEDTDMSTISTSNFNVSGNNGCSATPLVSFSKNQNRLILGIDPTCSDGGTIQLSLDLTTVRDLANNSGTGHFTKTYITNSNLPSLPSSNRLGGTVNSLPSSVELTFQADIDMSTVEASDFTVSGSGSCVTSPLLNFSKTNQVVNLSLSTAGCAHASGFFINLDMSLIQNNIGTVGAGLFSQSFILDIQGPSSATLAPPSATLANLPSTLTYTFSSDTDMASVSSSDFSLTSLAGCGSLSLQNLSKSGLSATLTVDTSSCAHSDSYSVSLNMSQIQDAYGNSGSGIVSGTYTLDNQGPASAEINLLSASRVSMPGAVIYTFSTDTQMDSVSISDFTVTGTGGCSTTPLLSLVKSAQNATLNLNTEGCTHGSSLSVSLAMSGVTDALGNAGSGSVGATYLLDTQGPNAAVISLASAVLRILPTSIIFTFPSDTDMNSVSAADFNVSSSGTCSLPGLSGISKAGFLVTVNLNTSGCLHNNSLTVSLDMTKVSDALGNIGSGSVFSTFTLDTQGPANPTVNLAGGTYSSHPNSITYTFPADTDMSSVTSSDFSSSTSGVCTPTPISGFSKSGQTVTLTIQSVSCVLYSSITLRVDMTGITDLLGNPGTGTYSQTYTKGL